MTVPRTRSGRRQHDLVVAEPVHALELRIDGRERGGRRGRRGAGVGVGVGAAGTCAGRERQVSVSAGNRAPRRGG